MDYQQIKIEYTREQIISSILTLPRYFQDLRKSVSKGTVNGSAIIAEKMWRVFSKQVDLSRLQEDERNDVENWMRTTVSLAFLSGVCVDRIILAGLETEVVELLEKLLLESEESS